MTEGICIECKEWTSLEESCCGSGVVIEGSVCYPDEIIEELPIGMNIVLGS